MENVIFSNVKVRKVKIIPCPIPLCPLMLFEKSCIGETELGRSNQEVAPSTGKNNKVALEPSHVCVSLQLFQVM